MNILHYLKSGDPPEPKNGIPNAVFEKQKELEEKYLPIEIANGLRISKSVPVDLDIARDQLQVKDVAFRLISELYEATQTLEENPVDRDHFFEELSDTLHFFVALHLLTNTRTILMDWRVPMQTHSLGSMLNLNFDEDKDKIRLKAFYITQEVIKTTECLKNKPWKQTHLPTDQVKFQSHLRESFKLFLLLLRNLGLTEKKIYRLYWAKNEVNKFRIKSLY